MQQYFYLLPFAVFDAKLLQKLAIQLEKSFNFPVKILSQLELAKTNYNPVRRQFDANKILAETRQVDFSDLKKIVGLCDVDLFASDLNFIFGVAEAPGRAAVVSTFRLRPEFSSPVKNEQISNGVLFYTRLLKEVIHELGHAFGLSHCPDKKCVMYYSNVIQDTDLKNTTFCEKCGKIYKAKNF